MHEICSSNIQCNSVAYTDIKSAKNINKYCGILSGSDEYTELHILIYKTDKIITESYSFDEEYITANSEIYECNIYSSNCDGKQLIDMIFFLNKKLLTNITKSNKWLFTSLKYEGSPSEIECIQLDYVNNIKNKYYLSNIYVNNDIKGKIYFTKI